MKVHLSDGEWKLMNKLWDTSPRTITELTAALREETGWSKNTVISRAKDRYETPEDFARNQDGERDWKYARIAKVYARYEAKLRAANALDFDEGRVPVSVELMCESAIRGQEQGDLRRLAADGAGQVIGGNAGGHDGKAPGLPVRHAGPGGAARQQGGEKGQAQQGGKQSLHGMLLRI